jgi:hypothetical protein
MCRALISVMPSLIHELLCDVKIDAKIRVKGGLQFFVKPIVKSECLLVS